ncbi:ATP-binding protein [Streptomyces jumonjinensis]|uniref:ATP-binding protein n=1 Tax=Streptomyces jumonjinensis TaxID=1945 RepID=UPI0037B26146
MYDPYGPGGAAACQQVRSAAADTCLVWCVIPGGGRAVEVRRGATTALGEEMNASAPSPPVPPPLHAVRYHLAAPNAASSAAILREQVCTVLRVVGLIALLNDARLCTSEAVTNVHLHTSSQSIKVDVLVGTQQLTVRVHDDAVNEMPLLRTADLDRPSGRGLHLVESVSDGWGVSQLGGLLPTAKLVWFRFDLRRRGVVA